MKLQDMVAPLLACLYLAGCSTASRPRSLGGETGRIDVPENWSSFRQSVANGNVEETRAGIERHPEWLRGEDNWTPLHAAATHGHTRVAKFLIASGADVSKRTGYRFAPLDEAVYSGRIEVAELLLAKGAEVAGRSKFGFTPLHWAAYRGHKDMVSLLIAKGAETNARDTEGWTPRRWAVERGHLAVARLICWHGGAGAPAELTRTLPRPFGQVDVRCSPPVSRMIRSSAERGGSGPFFRTLATLARRQGYDLRDHLARRVKYWQRTLYSAWARAVRVGEGYRVVAVLQSIPCFLPGQYGQKVVLLNLEGEILDSLACSLNGRQGQDIFTVVRDFPETDGTQIAIHITLFTESQTDSYADLTVFHDGKAFEVIGDAPPDVPLRHRRGICRIAIRENRLVILTKQSGPAGEVSNSES